MTENITDAVTKQIRITVNGKIDNIQGGLDTLKIDLQPVFDAYKGFKHVRAVAIFWVGGLLAIGGAIQAVQTLWGIVSPYVKL